MIGIINCDFDEDETTNCGSILQKILLNQDVESLVIDYWNNEFVRDVKDYNGLL